MTATVDQINNTDSEKSEDIFEITLTADGENSGWIQAKNSFSAEVSGITSDQIEIYGTNDKTSNPASAGHLIDPAISANGLYAEDHTPYDAICLRRVGSVDGDIKIFLCIQYN